MICPGSTQTQTAGHSFALDNLKAIWPNYAAIPSGKVIVPAVVADEEQLGQFRAAMPAEKLVVCELIAPKMVLRDRIKARGYNEYWLNRLQGFVDLYHSRSDLDRIRDFQVATHDRSIDESSQEIIEKVGWQSPAFPSV